MRLRPAVDSAIQTLGQALRQRELGDVPALISIVRSVAGGRGSARNEWANESSGKIRLNGLILSANREDCWFVGARTPLL